VFLALMLPSAMFEIVLIARRRCAGAACAYAASDVARTLLLAGPAIAVGSLRGLMAGAVTFAALRFGAMLVYFWREFGGSLRPDLGAWRTQLAYALPFALAVSLDVLQINLHQYVVAARFDAAAFAVYAVGCLQIPLVDVIVMSHANVMMVRLAERADAAQETLAIWHGTVTRLALVIFPLAVLLVIGAREIITVLFTTRYLASVPIFMLWSLSMLPAVFCVDSMLRALAQTRFLFVLNLVRLVVVAVLVGPLLSAFGMRGAVLVSLLAATVGVGLAVRRIARLTQATAAGPLVRPRVGDAAARDARGDGRDLRRRVHRPLVSVRGRRPERRPGGTRVQAAAGGLVDGRVERCAASLESSGGTDGPYWKRKCAPCAA
jgi:O-antigen/teichoic acid export membrane protein